jgi:hypothetical protein
MHGYVLAQNLSPRHQRGPVPLFLKFPNDYSAMTFKTLHATPSSTGVRHTNSPSA